MTMKLNPAALAAVRAGQALAKEHSAETLLAATINAIHADARITDEVAGQMEAHLMAWLFSLTGTPISVDDNN